MIALGRTDFYNVTLIMERDHHHRLSPHRHSVITLELVAFSVTCHDGHGAPGVSSHVTPPSLQHPVSLGTEPELILGLDTVQCTVLYCTLYCMGGTR